MGREILREHRRRQAGGKGRERQGAEKESVSQHRGLGRAWS